MKVRRSGKNVDLRNLPLDGFDMFLLAQLDGTLSVAELADIAPCDRAETIRRLNQLHRFEVVVLVPETTEERINLAAKAAPPEPEYDLEEEATTLRPPPRPRRNDEPSQVFSRTLAEDDAMTIRPPAPVSVQELMRAADESTVRTVVDRSSGVVEKKLKVEFQTPHSAVAPDGRSVRDRSVFSRATLVDEDVEERARAFEEPLRPAQKS